DRTAAGTARLAHRGIGIALAMVVVGGLAGRPFEADASLVEHLHQHPAEFGLLLNDLVDLRGRLERTADDLELPVAFQLLGAVATHQILLFAALDLRALDRLGPSCQEQIDSRKHGTPSASFSALDYDILLACWFDTSPKRPQFVVVRFSGRVAPTPAEA